MCDPSLEEVLGARAVAEAPRPAKEPVEEDPLLPHTHARGQVEGAARREGDEVDLALPQAFEVHRQHGDARGADRIAVGNHVEAVDVLARDLGVGADVDHVDALNIRPQVVDGLGDDPSGNQGLAEADLVGDQESPGRTLLEVQVAEDVRHCVALEWFEGAQGRGDVRAYLSHRGPRGTAPTGIRIPRAGGCGRARLPRGRPPGGPRARAWSGRGEGRA